MFALIWNVRGLNKTVGGRMLKLIYKHINLLWLYLKLNSKRRSSIDYRGVFLIIGYLKLIMHVAKVAEYVYLGTH